MANNSRYQATLQFQPSLDRSTTFRGLRPREIGAATPVLEHTLTVSDRPDLLANHYYRDQGRWWRILDANPELFCAAELADQGRIGTVILIPAVQESE